MSESAKAKRFVDDLLRLFDQLSMADDDNPTIDPIVIRLREVRQAGASCAETVIQGIESNNLRRRYQERCQYDDLDTLAHMVEMVADFDDEHPTATMTEVVALVRQPLIDVGLVPS